MPAVRCETSTFMQGGFGGREAQCGRHRLAGSGAVSAALIKQGERRYTEFDAKLSL